VRGVAAHWLAGAEALSSDYDMTLTSTVAEKNQRRQLLGKIPSEIVINIAT
jgi:hypothetical protein